MAINPAMSKTDRFMDKFDPQNSKRQIRKKMQKKVKPSAGNAIFGEKKVHDDKGCLVSNNADLCDCLVVECPGCFFPCPKCRSTKCGSECRVNRKWVYEQMEFEGMTTVVQHPYVKSVETLIQTFAANKDKEEENDKEKEKEIQEEKEKETEIITEESYGQ